MSASFFSQTSATKTEIIQELNNEKSRTSLSAVLFESCKSLGIVFNDILVFITKLIHTFRPSFELQTTV